MGDLRIRELGVLAPALAAGLAGTAVALGARGADSEFVYGQQNPPRIRAAEVERVVRTAPDPAVGTGAGAAARCRPEGAGPLSNPWTCVVRYRSGRRVRMVVRIADDGSYAGRYRGGGAARGCCIDIPGAE